MTFAPAEFDRLTNAIDNPDPVPGERAERRLESAGLTAGYGRLAELAAWWAGVCGDPAAPAPDRVIHVGGRSEWAGAGSEPRPAPPAPAPDPAPAPASDPDPAPEGWARPAGITVTVEVPLDPPDEVPDALRWGVAEADRQIDAGANLLLLTVDAPVHARVVAAHQLGLDAIEASGWPPERRLSDQAWMAEVAATRDGLAVTREVTGGPDELLDRLGSPRLAAALGLLLAASARRTPVLLDGPGAATAGLLARRLAFGANAWWQAVHLGADPLHRRTLDALRLRPLMELEIAVEDGTAARFGLPLLAAACELLVRAEATGTDEPEPAEEQPAEEQLSGEAPEAEAPDPEATEAEATEAEAPQAQVPAAEAPEAQAPATEVPEAQAPATEVPEAQVPATEVPEAQVPAAEAPEAEAAEGEVPAPGSVEPAPTQQAATGTAPADQR